MRLSYEECERYILRIPRFQGRFGGGKHTLKELREFLAVLGNPGMDKKVIHVAGTNGKGSVCAYLQSILGAAGISAGMFTSPHLVTMRERIMIDGEMVSEAEFTAAFREVRERAEGVFQPTFFEFLFLMAMLIFARRDMEYIILETGLGGRLDATNAVLRPKVCVITRIGYDHTEYLGETLGAIAGEKAGIMKPGVPVVTLLQESEVAEKLTAAAGVVGCPLYQIMPADLKINEIGNKSIDFSFHSRYDKYVSLLLLTKALYQTENAALAVQAAELLSDRRITGEHLREGLRRAKWPGRMEEVAPGVFLDGAHNEDGIRAFLASVRADGCSGRRYLLYGGVKEKRYRQIAGMLVQSGLFAEAAAAPLETARSLNDEELREAFSCYDNEDSAGRALPCAFCRDALAGLALLSEKKRAEDLIYIVGSLYLAGQIKRGKETSG